MRIWSILLIKSDLKWCIHLSRSLFSYHYLFHFVFFDIPFIGGILGKFHLFKVLVIILPSVWRNMGLQYMPEFSIKKERVQDRLKI